MVSVFNLNKNVHHDADSKDKDNGDDDDYGFSNSSLSKSGYESSTKQLKSIMNLTTAITSTGQL